ncbi:MAG: hypothetical protein ACOCZH_06305, partial [Phototrophicaceae bacterium]
FSTRQPDADAIIDYARLHPGESIHIVYPDATLDFAPPIAFYTGQPVTINDAENDADVIIYCHTDNVPVAGEGQVVGEHCTAFHGR